MKDLRTTRAGFTLIEVLVILALLGSVAGMLVPVLTNQMRRGQVQRTVGDLTSTRSAVESYSSDLSRLPGDMEDLAVAPVASTAATDADINARAYPSGLTARWKGPYLQQQLANGDSILSGFGGYIRDDFAVTAGTGGANYLTMVITGVSEEEFKQLDVVIDNGDDAGMTPGADATNGRLRYVTDTALDASRKVVKFLAIPIV